VEAVDGSFALGLWAGCTGGSVEAGVIHQVGDAGQGVLRWHFALEEVGELLQANGTWGFHQDDVSALEGVHRRLREPWVGGK
jgi:hypothetical protein